MSNYKQREALVVRQGLTYVYDDVTYVYDDVTGAT